MLTIFGHAGEEHGEAVSSGWVTDLLHQPTWVALVMVAAFLGLVFWLTRKLSFPTRLLVILVLLILIGVLYLPHNATVTGITLSVGFIAIFLFVFTLLAGVRR